MNRTDAGRLRRLWDRLLDGDRRWGSLSIRPDRMGLVRYRLVIYPPGITDGERRRLRVARAWPAWSLALWLSCEIALVDVVAPGEALAVSTALTLAAIAVAVLRAGPQRAQVHTMTVAVQAGYPDPAAAQRRRRLLTLAAELLESDELLEQGAIDPAAHEMVWWRVYDRLAEPAIAAPG
ncbi:DUF6611 family protein [Mycobacterium sp. NAZ190054]|uniref:DUF6611 family protein n=1 Tax=Mycobacterium sp. NAZ190054 TaxID=1747766 RepID=UPI0009EC34A7|nr:DUF6611 family protein [Mycobacterium sp. NAZ190054]